jgi:hypothetical protein
MTFDEFVAQEHKKRVAHFVNYINSTNRAPKLADVVEIFGFCERDAKPILADAIVALAA